ncbi:hypothetical protein T492DRAFT_1132191 [Pavlovales sp. CCMP2436]|nr:hypothetical protein T492DRAFT_1132191 [Pavlovales sp. CCMP2436]
MLQAPPARIRGDKPAIAWRFMDLKIVIATVPLVGATARRKARAGSVLRCHSYHGHKRHPQADRFARPSLARRSPRRQAARKGVGNLEQSRGRSTGMDRTRTFAELVCVLYDGIHYDALILLPAAGAPEEFATTVLAASDERIVELAKRQHEAHANRQLRTQPNLTCAASYARRGSSVHTLWTCCPPNANINHNITNNPGQVRRTRRSTPKATGHVNFSEY